jgi:hypothetical protein
MASRNNGPPVYLDRKAEQTFRWHILYVDAVAVVFQGAAPRRMRSAHSRPESLRRISARKTT